MLPPWSRYCCPFPFPSCEKEKEKHLLFFSAKTLFKMRCISGQYKKPWAWAQSLCRRYFTAWLCIRKSCWLHGFPQFLYILQIVGGKYQGNPEDIFHKVGFLIKFVWKHWENHQSNWSRDEVGWSRFSRVSTAGFMESCFTRRVLFLYHVCVLHLNSSIL